MVLFPIAVILLINFRFAKAQDWLDVSKEELLVLRNSLSNSGFENSVADIVFLVDTSSSLWEDDYQEEKTFVTNLLNEISVTLQATRVEVIPFGLTASKYITQVSSPSVIKNKCTFSDSFKTMPQSINGWTTNMKEAFQLAYDVCLNDADKRVAGESNAPIRTIVILLTDGKWNRPYDDPSPISIAQDLITAGVEVLAIGVGKNIDFDNLKLLVEHPDKQAFHLSDFDEFSELATYIRGGKIVNQVFTSACFLLKDEKQITQRETEAFCCCFV